jgi:hypothetical protein
MTTGTERLGNDPLTLLAGVGGDRAATAADAALDPCDLFDKQLCDRMRADVDHHDDAESTFTGAALAMLALIRYAHADRLRQTIGSS